MRTGIIYLITNTVNGKQYVGQTLQSLKRRWQSHRAAVSGASDLAIHRAIRKYGHESFTIEVVAESYEPFLDTVEKLAIWSYQSHTSQNGYNMTAGGDDRAMLSEESRQKLVAWATGRKRSDEACAKHSAALKGKKRPPRSVQWVANLSAATKAHHAIRLALHPKKCARCGGSPEEFASNGYCKPCASAVASARYLRTKAA